MRNSVESPIYHAQPPLVTFEQFGQIMQQGVDIAVARHVWRFNQERLQAQLGVVSGPRAQQSSEPVRPRPNASGNQSTRTLPAPRNPFVQEQQALQYNQAVLAAQDERLNSLGNAYARNVATMYAEAVGRLAKMPMDRISLETLSAFERFRFNQVELCINGRGKPDNETATFVVRQYDVYAPIAKAVVAASRARVVSEVNAARSSAELQQKWTEFFSSPWLRELAASDATMMRALATRSQTLIAQEEAARQEALRKLAAEEARQVALQRKKFMDNAANNVAPTSQEVTVLATTYLIEKSETYTGSGTRMGPLQRTGDDSFDEWLDNPFLGRLLASKTKVSVGVQCRPKGRVQACSVNMTTTAQRNTALFGLIPGFTDTVTHEAEFQWTAAGLTSPSLKASIKGMRWTGGGGGSSGSSSGSYGRSSDSDDFNRNLDEFRERQRDEAARVGRPYMGESGESLRKQYGY